MPAPTPFTMEDVVNAVLIELRYAPGRDVQIHLQTSVVQDANILYRTLMQKFLWRDFYKGAFFETDPDNGAPVVDPTPYMNKFSDLKAVWLGNSDRPLPFLSAMSNPLALRQPTVIHALYPHIFAIYPTGTVYKGVFRSQPYQDTDFDLDDEVPFYKDVLVLGTAYQLSLKAGTNMELTGSLKSQFESLLQTYRMDEVKPQYPARPVNVPNPMTDWWAPS